MNYIEAKNIADAYEKELSPMCDRIMVCSGIRRKSKQVSDIDIVLVRKGSAVITFKKWFDSKTIVKGNWYGKNVVIRAPEGILLDITMCQNRNFGNMVLIRTGPGKFSKRFVWKLRDNGLCHRNGFIRDQLHHIPVPCHTEPEAFHYAKMKEIEPALR